MSHEPVDLSDPRWFPVDLDVRGGRVHFLRIDESVVARASFLDNRMPVEASVVTPLALEDLAPMAAQPAPAWLWHTSFCGSTLLARMLHLAPYSTSLREPLLLRRLSDAADAGADVTGVLGSLVGLLARPWHPGGRIVIKPTHAGLNIAAPLLQASPGGRVLVMTSSLDDFLVSHLKKTEETLSKTVVLAERALRAGDFRLKLGGAALSPPDPLAAAALQWAAQRELVSSLLDQFGDRIRIISWDAIHDDLPAAAAQAAEWLQLGIPVAELRAHATVEAGIHAKVPGRQYGPSERNAENEWLRSQYSGLLTGARKWAEAHVLPHMRPDAVGMA